ncbi:hypothetical protein [Bartonella apihabitans]
MAFRRQKHISGDGKNIQATAIAIFRLEKPVFDRKKLGLLN